MSGWIVIASLAVLAFLVWASADISSGVYVRTFCRRRYSRRRELQPGDRSVALTFDDGPAGEQTEKVLDVLKRHHVRATFFLIGEQVERYPETVERMKREGHVLGLHTYSHSTRFPLTRRENVIQEIERCRTSIERLTGLRPRLFRPPFGVTNPIIGNAVRCMHLDCIGWSIRSFDTVGSRSRNRILRKIVRRLKDGDVILLHDRCEKSESLLEAILNEIELQGYSVVTVDKLFEIKAYEN